MPTVADELTARWGSRLSIVDDPDGARHVVGLRLHTGDPQAARRLLDLHRGIRRLAGPEYGPRSADLPGTPSGTPHSYGEAFGAKVRFRRSAALLRLPAGVLSGSPGHPAPERSDLARRVRHLLTERLGHEPAALGDVARAIAVHPRTLQRTLADEGLSFAEILDCVRRERARSCLAGTDLPVTEISARLGFAEPGVLTRCCRRWWGVTPTRARSDRRAG